MSRRIRLPELVEPPQESQRRLAELSSLYEAARTLLGARNHAQVASRVIHSSMGVMGARSGAMFVADDRGRYRLVHSSGLDDAERGEMLPITAQAREWLLCEGAFATDGASAARLPGELRDRLVEHYDAAVAVAVSDAHGLLGLMVFGPRVLPGDYEDEHLALLDSLASLAAQALATRPARDPDHSGGLYPTDGVARRGAGPRGPARDLELLREAHPPLQAMVGESAALLETCRELVAVAPTPFPVLLTGESGVGKELAAHAIHGLSERAEGPFEVVDCGSIPRDLIESELFGHVRGAFTGAHRDRRGAFELAHRGTLFLDEIGEMPLPLQKRLLRVLQEGRFRRVGDERVIDGDVRVVAATNRDLRAEVDAKRFREDLYYRLTVFSIRVPPLRERIEDMVPLLRHIQTRQCKELGVKAWEMDADVIGALGEHSWPGNIRELTNLCAALTVRARQDGHITREDLDQVWRRQHAGEDPPWSGTSRAPRGRLGEWVLVQVRAARFNVIEAARLLQRRKRSGQAVPLTERSALSYYMIGETLRLLVEAEGDTAAAARAVAGCEELLPRVLPRVQKVADALRAAHAEDELKHIFVKLPAGYEEILQRAHRLVARR
ncbi:MAG: sigma-54-dependent Fis family transcriptional regulator [Candidatus Eisenbacteria bacterium]|uniref:Sigma-54-dependent Fis family transcriptional regulator n=1 Tax=Eiseniibacteriota bacterium TaxID=2212470 RepID=A0A538UE93_UNCEI|nr:MAG: sigma-54-dependent Fis family transcriptional regulator [Candidatus Eisenbacteria bacterium]